MVQAESNMTPNTMGPGRIAKAELKAKATLILTALSLGSTARRVMRKFGSLAEAPTSEPKAMMAMKALKAPPQPEGQYPDTALMLIEGMNTKDKPLHFLESKTFLNHTLKTHLQTKMRLGCH